MAASTNAVMGPLRPMTRRTRVVSRTGDEVWPGAVPTATMDCLLRLHERLHPHSHDPSVHHIVSASSLTACTTAHRGAKGYGYAALLKARLASRVIAPSTVPARTRLVPGWVWNQV